MGVMTNYSMDDVRYGAVLLMIGMDVMIRERVVVDGWLGNWQVVIE